MIDTYNYTNEDLLLFDYQPNYRITLYFTYGVGLCFGYDKILHRIYFVFPFFGIEISLYKDSKGFTFNKY